jgi:hypothetical protein
MKSVLVGVVLLACACSSGSGGTSTGTSGGATTTGGATGGGTTGASCPAGLCGGVCCASTDTCIDNACCAAANVCGGSACCGSGTVCFNQAGATSCATTCSKPSDCPSANPCCMPMPDGHGGVLQTGVCSPVPVPANAYQCICQTTADCDSNCCAPHVDALGAPVGPLVCKPFDGAAYDCCTGLSTATPCAGLLCCFGDSAGNHFCAPECTDSSTCGAAQCINYPDISMTSCGSMGCGI